MQTYTITWRKPGQGKEHKRRLAKAERKAAKAAVRGQRCNRRLSALRSEVNYKAT